MPTEHDDLVQPFWLALRENNSYGFSDLVNLIQFYHVILSKEFMEIDMPVFPRKEKDIAALANAIWYGIERHWDDFPRIKFIPYFIALRDYKSVRRSCDRAHAESRKATAAKQKALKNLIVVMKKCLKLSEVDTIENPTKLGLIGWGPPAEAHRLRPPAPPRDLTVCRKCGDSILLAWNRVKKGREGPVRNIIVQSRCTSATCRPDEWQTIALSYTNSTTLTTPPIGTTTDYRVIASNTAGKSLPSNTTTLTEEKRRVGRRAKPAFTMS